MKTSLDISDKNTSDKKYSDIEISLLPVQNWTQQMTLKDDFFIPCLCNNQFILVFLLSVHYKYLFLNE